MNTITTHYDLAGRVRSVADNFSSSTYTYDTLDRPASEIIRNAGTPLVVLNTNYGLRLDGLRTSSCLENIPNCY